LHFNPFGNAQGKSALHKHSETISRSLQWYFALLVLMHKPFLLTGEKSYNVDRWKNRIVLSYQLVDLDIDWQF